MERSSALARHRKRRLLDASQHASTHVDLAPVLLLAAATSVAQTRVAPGDAATAAVRVLRNASNSVFRRGVCTFLSVAARSDSQQLTRAACRCC